MPYEILLKDFIKIKSRGYIKAVGHGSSMVGRTFEDMLRIKENNMAFADYFGIEIKCFSREAEDYITLLSMEPESVEGNIIKKIATNYGYPDKEYKNINILNTYVNANKTRFISLKYKGEVFFNEKNLYILIRDKYDRVIDNSARWSIERINDSFNDKCKYLAIISSKIKYYNKVPYIKYDDIKIYRLKHINKWLRALETGEARINFKISVRKSGKLKGELHNHGTSFQIQYKAIENVFERII